MLGEETALWESTHYLLDLNVDISIFSDFGGEIILIEKSFGEVAEFEAHVFVAGHMGVEVEIFDVHSHEPGYRGVDDTVDDELYCEEIGGGHSTVVWVV